MGIHISQQVCEPEYWWSFDRSDILENETSFSLPRTPNLSGGQYFSNINAFHSRETRELRILIISSCRA